MKNVISLLLIVCVCLFSGCADTPQKEGDSLPEQNLPSVSEEQTGSVDEGGEEVYLIINGNALKVTLAENSSVSALMELLRENDISYTANDYGGFEKVGSLGFSLPRNDMRITAEPGDVILYQGDQIVLLYGSNSWSYTRLGKIEGYSRQELRELLCAGEGSVKVTLSLNHEN